MSEKYEYFYDTLKNYLESYSGSFNDIINYSPDLFKLLNDILNEKVITAPSRLKICAAIGYFVIPLDVIPESIYGPDGYVDDLYVCCYILKDIINEIGYSSVEDLWEGPEELQIVLEKCLKESENILGKEQSYVLKYIGIE